MARKPGRAPAVSLETAVKELQQARVRIDEMEAKLAEDRKLERTLSARLARELGFNKQNAPVSTPSSSPSPRKKSAGGKRGRKGEKAQAVLAAIGASKGPITIAQLVEQLGGSPPSMAQTVMKLRAEKKIVGLKKDGEDYRKPKEGERASAYTLVG